MSIRHLDNAKQLKEIGSKLGRDGMSERAIQAVNEWDGKSYKGVMILVGKLKAIAQMANCDDYWHEQVERGFYEEFRHPLPEHIAKFRNDVGIL